MPAIKTHRISLINNVDGDTRVIESTSVITGVNGITYLDPETDKMTFVPFWRIVQVEGL